MSITNAVFLRSRWTPERVARLRAVLPVDPYPGSWPTQPVLRASQDVATVHIANEPFLDLRGFPLAILARIRQSRIDFSYAKSPHNEHDVDVGIRVTSCELANCLFDHVQTIYHIDGSHSGCSFVQTRMREAQVRGTFESCSFRSANLTGAQLGASRFVNCSFEGTNLKKAAMGRAVFDRCGFAGALFGGGAILGTKFLSCNFNSVDIADALRDEATYFDEGCDLTGIRFREVTRMFGHEMPVGPPPRPRKAT